MTKDSVLFQGAYQAKFYKVMDHVNLVAMVREQSKLLDNAMENVKIYNVSLNKFWLKQDVNTVLVDSNPHLIEEVVTPFQDVTADNIETLMEIVSLAKIIMFYQLMEQDVRQSLAEQTRKKQLLDFALLVSLVHEYQMMA